MQLKQIYFAPLEGITGYVYRNTFHKYFGGIDKYFIPFINPNQKGKFSAREREDICPEHNRGMYAVPQLLTNSAEHFTGTAAKLEQFGYGEVNLNLGCPSRTVVTKGRGSGFLAQPEKLDLFLEQIFSETKIKISIKTRIGIENPEEFERLMHIYEKYPLSELIIHPRVQTDFYKHTPNRKVFGEAAQQSRHPLCYNGDICTAEEYEEICALFPQLHAVMIGRGFLMDPGLADRIRSGTDTKRSEKEKERVRAFHDELLERYKEVLFGEKPVLFKMKELWFYMGPLFENCEKYMKKIRKAERIDAYKATVDALFEEQKLKETKRRCAADGNTALA